MAITIQRQWAWCNKCQSLNHGGGRFYIALGPFLR